MTKDLVYYTPELGQRIASLIAQDFTYSEIEKILGIANRTLSNWMVEKDDLVSLCARARPAQADSIEEKMAEIMQEVRDGTLAPEIARVLLPNMQWRASKKNPRVYGDKTILSNDPDNPVGGLALRLDDAIIKRNQVIDVTPEQVKLPPPDDYSDLA